MNIFSRKTVTPLVEAPQGDPFNDPADERCANVRCPKFINEQHTPRAVVYCGLTFCEESCVPPSLRLKQAAEIQQERANREKAQRDAIELAKANRIITLRNQIAFCEEHQSALEAAGVDYDSHVKQFTDALAAELDPGNTSPNLVITAGTQILHSSPGPITSFRGE
jgi:hypothetical protein